MLYFQKSWNGRKAGDLRIPGGFGDGGAAGGKDDDAAEIDGGNRAQVCDAGWFERA